jgi:uncharacterized protein YutE (UPF0331/DUF86 family)
MESEVIQSKLESLSRCIARIELKTPDDPESLQADPDIQDIIAINLERAVQICVDIALHWISKHSRCEAPQTMGNAFRILESEKIISQKLADQLVAAVGFRNLSVHSYDQINWDIVWSIITKDIRVFKDFAREFTSQSSE